MINNSRPAIQKKKRHHHHLLITVQRITSIQSLRQALPPNWKVREYEYVDAKGGKGKKRKKREYDRPLFLSLVFIDII